MKKINNKIKVVFWDLDDTLWEGTLAEGDDVRLFEKRAEIIKTLNKRGIVSAVCSKNNFDQAKKKLIDFGIWDQFVFPRIAFEPKGKIIRDALLDMHLRAENALFIDDNNMNLNEAEYYNSGISVVSADECDDILEAEELAGKDDSELSRYNQYKQLEEKTEARKNSSSNDDFLRQSNIRIEFLDYTEELCDRLYELAERTNQLNFTKIRISKEQAEALLSDKEAEIKLIHVTDNFGDYGIIGFYVCRKNRLEHFVFSCRIMNMGIEQFVYDFLGYPDIEIQGEVASEIGKHLPAPDYIQITEHNENDGKDEDLIQEVLSDESKINIFAIGACDLYHPIAYFSMPNQSFVYECNVFKGEERGVNVGTEYIRSHFELNEAQKEYCRTHFFNYTGSTAFKSRIFSEEWDYIIMSFHDDMIYKVYQSKNDPDLRVVLSPEKIFGLTSVINIDDGVSEYPVDEALQKEWLEKNFEKGEYITEERFYENVMWISEKVSPKTRILLINGPELDFFREEMPHCPEVLEQIKKLNRVIERICEQNSDRFTLVDINAVIRSRYDVTNYVFHLTADTSYNLFLRIAFSMFDKLSGKKPMLSDSAGDRQTVIFGNDIEAVNALIDLKLGGCTPVKFIHQAYQGRSIGDNPVEDWKQIIGRKEKYFVVVADQKLYPIIRKLLILAGYEPLKDFVQFKAVQYNKVWNEG